MKRTTAILLSLVFAAVLILPAGVVRAESQVWIHFIVISKHAKDGGDAAQALRKLKVKLAELAGGYTYLGTTQGGWLPPGGKLENDENQSFMVSAKRDLTPELETLVPKYFKGPKPFILVWPGKSNY